MPGKTLKNRKKFLLTGLTLGLSLLISMLLTIALYVNWRRLEGAVLGLKP